MNKRRLTGVSLCVKGKILVAAAIALAACADAAEVEQTTSSLATTRSTVATNTSLAPQARSECVPGRPKQGIDLQYENIIRAYQGRNTEGLVRLIGDGPVFDPSLEPEGLDLYPNLAAWLEAASRMDDRWTDRGYGFSEPFQLFLERSNPTLEEAGIDGLDITFEFWVTQDCELRVGSTDIISHPDPCRYFQLYDSKATPQGCLGPFEPRASHAAVWTGAELLIYGGTDGADIVDPLRNGLAYDPESDTWRDIAPSPVGISWWPDLEVVWTGDRLIIFGFVRDGETYRTGGLANNPETDSWQSIEVPEARDHVGAVVWTGQEVLLVGGDLNAPDDTAWGYNPDTGQWRQLGDPGIDPVEGMQGVWTGTEAIFAGGYSGPQPFQAMAYNRSLDTWRSLPPPLGRQLEQHEIVWTGSLMILYSGHGPPHADRLLIYDPTTDTWRESSPMPMLPAERLAGAWTGDRLIIWGGYATYGEHDEDGDAVFGHGASYDPVTDTWELLPAAPISDRCDHSGTWTETEFIVFGGMPLCGTPGILPLGDAAAYDPETKTWRLIEK